MKIRKILEGVYCALAFGEVMGACILLLLFFLLKGNWIASIILIAAYLACLLLINLLFRFFEYFGAEYL